MLSRHVVCMAHDFFSFGHLTSPHPPLAVMLVCYVPGSHAPPPCLFRHGSRDPSFFFFFFAFQQGKRKEAFSRRRSEHSAADIDYINDRNKHFNKKIKRAYDKYTVEIRQNLERGTAL